MNILFRFSVDMWTKRTSGTLSVFSKCKTVFPAIILGGIHQDLFFLSALFYPVSLHCFVFYSEQSGEKKNVVSTLSLKTAPNYTANLRTSSHSRNIQTRHASSHQPHAPTDWRHTLSLHITTPSEPHADKTRGSPEPSTGQSRTMSELQAKRSLQSAEPRWRFVFSYPFVNICKRFSASSKTCF